jgi:hypothetical protein
MTPPRFDLRTSRLGEVCIVTPDGFESIGTIEGDIVISRETVERQAEDCIPFTTKVEASWSVPIDPDEAFQARRNLARIAGLPLPTTAGIDLWPDIERRAAAALTRSQKLSNRKAGAR